MRNWFAAQELAGLPGLPSTARNVKAMAARESWEGQQRLGSKAIEYAFAVLPKATQIALIAASVSESQPLQAAEPEPNAIERDPVSASRLSEDQRSVMIARLAFVREIERISQTISQQRAIDSLVALAKADQLSRYLSNLVQRANDRKTSDRTLSERTLKRWLSDYRKKGETGLAPGRREKDMSVPEWSASFLSCYQRPTKPSVESAYAEFALKHPAERPSIHVVRRFLNKLSAEARERGRRTPQELKALQPFKRRLTKNLLPCDVFTADGHKFDAEVLNPRTGKPYRPETTTVIDVATRKALGISIGEAESTIGVMDALRDAVQHGMFALFYVDNGSGFANDTVREVVDRLGGEMTHALPYNSQARGLIERAHQTIWVNAAKKLTSYIGADMDKHAGTKVHRISRKQLRETGATRLIPTFAEFMAGVEYEIKTYNDSPHRGLAKIRDRLTGKLRHMSPNEAWDAARVDGWEPMIAPADVLNDLMRPQVIRPTRRGEVTWSNETYFLDALRNFHGEEIRVAYDVRDASRVWVRSIDGDLIGEALLDGNASDYMPKAMIEKAYDKRETGQMKRALDKLETLTGKRVEMIATTSAPSAQLTVEQLAEAQRFAQLSSPQASAFDLPSDPTVRYHLWHKLADRISSGETLTPEETQWHSRYPSHPDFASIRRMFEFAEQRA
ncbi:Mu transposase C-terminal domain-containing protein [Pseudomonas fluorescens]|uniref:Mu transposase C-terminal domain-containing protein n=1 Tax=Pseudomonas fluorescens TaxID=294 RepID=UPI0007D05A74|nr:Mu transposase C-terminal domain-containing protein [Pseudomonas fluorescens]